MYPLKGTIVFSDASPFLFIFNAKNSHKTIKEFFKAQVFGLEPQFSQTGNEILFTKNNPLGWPLSESPRQELVVVDRVSRKIRKILDMGQRDCDCPAWSPDGSRIVFLGMKGAYRSELFIASTDGSNIRKVTSLLAFPSRPSWIPDSKRIVFSSQDGIIYSINDDGTDIRKITGGWASSVSPDGKKLAFKDARNIYICDINGKHERMIVRNYERLGPRTPTFVSGYPTELSWSPDGKHLLYSRSAWGIYSDLVVVSTGWPHRKKVLYTMGGSTLRGFSWAKN